MRPRTTRGRSAPAGPIAFAIVLVVGMLVLGSWGSSDAAGRSASLANIFILLVNAGLLAAAYVFAGFGLGRPLEWALSRLPGVRESESEVGPLWLQAVLGTGALLWLSHALGTAGLLSGHAGLWVGWLVVAAGLALLGDQVLRGPLRPERWPALPIAAIVVAPALAALLVAACSPPAALWVGARSEAGAYDVLSYHLQLPKEWIDPGSRLWPTEHNVYSFLPGYMEAAYLHVGALARGGKDGGGSFVAGSGMGVIACQFVHAAMGILSALLAGRVVLVIARRRAEVTSASPLPGIVAAAAFLGVPWVMVVGSLAYNELGMTAMLAGALLAALQSAWTPAARGVAVGLLMGIACSVKPTALFMAAPLAGLFLLGVPRLGGRERFVSILAGTGVGLIAIAPWLVRNWLACGNPVFPFAHGLFGTSHWTSEQFARYAAAHRFDGSLVERLSLLFDADRGVLNEQWAILFPLGILALIGVTARTRTRRFGVLLSLGLAVQIVAWLWFTHLQSRFLLPCVVPLAIALGLGANELIRWVTSRTGPSPASRGLPLLARLVALLVPISLTGWSWLIFMAQRQGHPNDFLAVGGVEFLTGEAFATELAQRPRADRERQMRELRPEAFVNFTLAPDQGVYLVAGATPLYFVPPGGPESIIYNTTWDRNPLADAIRAQPDDPAAWTAAVRATRRDRAVDFVLVDLDEYNRLYPQDGRRPVWYDAAVKPDLLRRWLSEQCELVQPWPTGDNRGTFLFRFRRPGADGSGR